VRHTNGPAYVTAALAYGWQDITTDRIVTAAGIDHLRAEFDANAWSGRMEGGYRFVAPLGGGIGLTPYAAAQFTTFDLPAYAEQVISGASTFALSYGAHSPTDTRTELGLRSDKSFALDNAVLTLRGRVAWAHDFDPDRLIAATFQALPGASFVVNGAASGRGLRAHHGLRRIEMGQWLIGRDDVRGRVLERDALLRRQGRGALRVVRQGQALSSRPPGFRSQDRESALRPPQTRA
jgi:hypothetical protein